MSIIRDGFIRFTDIEYMNDKSETVYAVKVLLDFLDQHAEKYLFTRDVLNALIGKQSYPDIQSLKTTTIEFSDFAGFANLNSAISVFPL